MDSVSFLWNSEFQMPDSGFQGPVFRIPREKIVRIPESELPYMRRLLAIFPPVIFLSVDLFFGRRRPINTTDVVAGNPRFHHIKTVLC